MSPTSRRRAAVTALAALAAAVPALVAAAPAGAVAPALSGESGYAATAGRFTSVAATWVQPAAPCSDGAGTVAHWVGLDGIDDANLEQIGSVADCTGGAVAYHAFYENYPASPVYFNDVVGAGDRLTASVATDGNGAFTSMLADTTRGWTRTVHKQLAPGEPSSAEVMTDFATAAGPASKAHVVSFTGATVNGQPLGSFSPQPYQAPGTTTSPLTGGTAFTVRWGAAAE